VISLARKVGGKSGMRVLLAAVLALQAATVIDVQAQSHGHTSAAVWGHDLHR
jgi:hypothetical protein